MIIIQGFRSSNNYLSKMLAGNKEIPVRRVNEHSTKLAENGNRRLLCGERHLGWRDETSWLEQRDLSRPGSSVGGDGRAWLHGIKDGLRPGTENELELCKLYLVTTGGRT